MGTLEWREVIGYEGLYLVSDNGKVKGVKRGKILKPAKMQGYPYVNLSKEGVVRPTPVHRIVASAFLGPRPEGMHTRHLDNNKENNTKENLRYGSVLDNAMDNYKAGRYRYAPMTVRKRIHLRRLLRSGHKQVDIAAALNIGKSTVNRESKLMYREQEQA